MVSIIMPVYNEEKYVANAIESVLKQTYTDWELVIVNDASTDRSDSIIKEFMLKDNRISYYALEINKGCANALNEALSHVRGSYICWLSGDDEYYPNMLSDSIKYLEEHKQFQAVFSKHIFYNEDSGQFTEWESNERYLQIGLEDKANEEPYFHMIFYGNAFNACTVLGEKEAFVKAGKFSMEHNYAGDYEYMMRLCAYSNIGFLDSFTVKSRIHAEQVSMEGKNEFDAIDGFTGMLFCDEERKSLFDKAGVNDCRETVRTAFEFRKQMYAQIGMRKEAIYVEKAFDAFQKRYPRCIEADSKCKVIAEMINSGMWEEACKEVKNVPKETSAYMNWEIWGILLATINSYLGNSDSEKELLELVLSININNCEANYMLAKYYERCNQDKEAVSYYKLALSCAGSEEDYTFIMKEYSAYINKEDKK